MKKEFKVIADLLPNNTRVLDVGCGDGSLMNFLVKEKNIETRGLELDQNNVQKYLWSGATMAFFKIKLFDWLASSDIFG